MSKYLLGFFIIGFLVMLTGYGVDYSLYTFQIQRVKHHLNLALHAASIPVVEADLANGKISIDTLSPEGSKEWFMRILQKNMGLDSFLTAQDGSYVNTGDVVKVHELVYANDRTGEFVNMLGTPSSACELDADRVKCDIKINEGTDVEADRSVNEMIVGPSVLAVIEVPHHGIGSIADEPIVTVGVQEVLRRK